MYLTVPGTLRKVLHLPTYLLPPVVDRYVSTEFTRDNAQPRRLHVGLVLQSTYLSPHLLSQ